MLNEQVNLLPLSKDTEDENLVRNLFYNLQLYVIGSVPLLLMKTN